jgi:hypothetical protein
LLSLYRGIESHMISLTDELWGDGSVDTPPVNRFTS